MPGNAMPQWIPRTRGWRDLSLQNKCLLLISAPAAATVLMFGVANWLANGNAAAGDQLDRELETAREIQRLHASESEISADVRAYFITGDEAFAIRARSSLAAFDSARLQLIRLTLAIPAEQQRLAQIGAIEHAREERMFGDMARFRSGVLSRGELQMELATVQQGRVRMQELLKFMEVDNSRRVETQLGRVQTLRAEQGTLTGLCLLFGLVGGAAMTVLFARGITRRIDGLRQNVSRLAAGAAPQSLDGQDEIGALNQALFRVSEILRRKGVALENAPQGIAEVAADGRYLWLNRMFAEMTGRAGIHKRAHIDALVQPDDRPRVEQAIAEMRASGRSQIAARLDQPGGRGADVGVTFLSTAEETTAGPEATAGRDATFYVFLRDIWAGKRDDAGLLRAKEAAESSNRAKTEFLAKISHDIRTPLNAILGSADLLSQTPLNFDQSEYVSMFQRNCRHLIALINDFLDFSRIEAGAVRIERVPFRIREIMHDAVATFREPAARKGLALEVEIDPAAPASALGDPLRIQQILVNLLSNAVKFTPAGSVGVNVKVLIETGFGDKLRFEVSDSGPGIRLEDQDKIFAHFVQLPNPSNGQRGTGLGLTICRDLVELMQGEIGVVSQEGRGSTFYFDLPLEPVDDVAERPDAAEDASAELCSNAPVRILLAEDTEDNRLLLVHYLRDQPVRLRIATNGQEALDAVQQGEQFDLILMDIDMPDMDGYTATRQIRAFQQTAGGAATPVVALSADAMQEAVSASLEAGCVAHVAKPVDRDTLLKTIRRFAAMHGTAQARPPGPALVSEQVKALVPQYLASKTKQIEEARSALASRDFGPIRRFGHNLKGTGRGYGFPVIEEMGKEIERAATEADAERIASQLDALHRFVSQSATLINS